MTFLLPRSTAGDRPARGADAPLPTTWQGFNATISTTRMESVGDPVARAEEMERATSAVDLASRIGLDAIIRRESDVGDGYDHLRPAPTSIEQAVGEMGDRFSEHVYSIAREQAAENPGAWTDVDLSDEGVQERARQQMQREYQDAQDMLDMLPEGRRLIAEFGGEAAGMMTDPVNVALLGVGGGGGSFLRIMGREAVLNMGAEAVTMPTRFEMAEYLEIEDPDVLQSLAIAGAAGGLLGGLVEAGARGVTYFRGINRRQSQRDAVSEQALVDRAEDAILTSDAVFDDVKRALDADPAPTRLPPLILRAEQEVPAFSPRDESDFDLIPDMPQAEPIEDMDAVISGLTAAVEEARAADPFTTRPLTDILRRAPKKEGARLIGEDLRIHPDGEIGRELKWAGITSRTHPGLFARSGRKDLDNLVASEWEDRLPGITDATRTDRGAGYLDRQGLIDLIIRDAGGDSDWLEPRAARLRVEQDLEEAVRVRDEGKLTSQDDFLAEIDTGSGFYVERGTPSSDVSARMEDHLQSQGYNLTDQEFLDIRSELSEYGGDGALLIERSIERELDDLEARYGSPDSTSGDAADARGERRGETAGGEPGAGRGIADAPERSGALGQSETTAAGEQSLIPGVAPVTQRQRLEQRQRAKLVGMAKEADDGLFDVAGRSQMDWLDKPSEANPVDAQREADLRDAVAKGDDPVLPAADGREMRLSEALDDLDTGDAFAARIALCGMGPT